jgi:hypothetical protein
VAAQRAGLAPPPIAAIRRLFQAQMAAAKQVQWESLRDPESRATVLELDLKTELRPALLRIGDRIGQLLAALPADLDGPRVREMARRELRTPYLSESTMLTIADAISELSSARKGQRNRVDSEPGGKP